MTPRPRLLLEGLLCLSVVVFARLSLSATFYVSPQAQTPTRARRQYCNPRGGRIPGGATGMNATFYANIPMSGSKANGIRCSDCVNTLIDHVSVFGTGVSATGIATDDRAQGTGPDRNSTNTLSLGSKGPGFKVRGYNNWSASRLVSFKNGTPADPLASSNWGGGISTSDPGMGTCRAWIPHTSSAKGAGTGGSDIGATILYRYINGALTDVPLWNPSTGEFPHGEADLHGLNRVLGNSLFDFHKRINVNSGGCPFQSGYGTKGKPNPAAPRNLIVR